MSYRQLTSLFRMSSRPSHSSKGVEYERIDDDIQPALEQFNYVKDEIEISRRQTIVDIKVQGRCCRWLFKRKEEPLVLPDLSFEAVNIEHNKERALANWNRSKHAIIRRLRVSRIMLGAYYHKLLREEHNFERKRKQGKCERFL